MKSKKLNAKKHFLLVLLVMHACKEINNKTADFK